MSPSPLRSQLVVPLTHRLRTSLDQIASTAGPQLRAAWEKLGEHNEAQIGDFERLARPIVTAAKAAAVSKSVGYYALIAGVRPPPVAARHVPVEADLRGPFIQSWKTLSVSGNEDAARTAGGNRAEAAAVNLVASASRLTGAAVYDRANVVTVGWERDPEPNACDWCLDAAQTTYGSAEATDFGHDNCQCLGVPLF